MRLADSPYGSLDYVNGELLNRAKENDPVAYRGGSAQRSLVKWSGDHIRPDGVHEELVLDQYKRDERHLASGMAGEVTRHLRAPGQLGADTLIETVRFDGATYHVPIIAAAGIVGSVSATPPAFLRSHEGRYRLHMQDDGHLVAYDDVTGQAASVAWVR